MAAITSTCTFDMDKLLQMLVLMVLRTCRLCSQASLDGWFSLIDRPLRSCDYVRIILQICSMLLALPYDPSRKGARPYIWFTGFQHELFPGGCSHRDLQDHMCAAATSEAQLESIVSAFPSPPALRHPGWLCFFIGDQSLAKHQRLRCACLAQAGHPVAARTIIIAPEQYEGLHTRYGHMQQCLNKIVSTLK